jgi:GxxExxY protein
VVHDTAGYEALTGTIIECGIRVHETFGPGLLETVYKECTAVELREAGLGVETARRVPLRYRGRLLDAVYCPDLVVEGRVIVELKARRVDRGGSYRAADHLLEAHRSSSWIVDEFQCPAVDARRKKSRQAGPVQEGIVLPLPVLLCACVVPTACISSSAGGLPRANRRTGEREVGIFFDDRTALKFG